MTMQLPPLPDATKEILALIRNYAFVRGEWVYGNGPSKPSAGEVEAEKGKIEYALRALTLACKERDALIAELWAVLPCAYYMDPPDGGDVSLTEQMRRMAKDAQRYRDQTESFQFINDLSAGWDDSGSTGPKAPFRWETVARMSMDIARAALAKVPK